MKRRRWKRINSSKTHYVLHVTVRGVCIEAVAHERIGDLFVWMVFTRTGDKMWTCGLECGRSKTLADAKAKAEAELDKVVGKMIDDLTKWRGK